MKPNKILWELRWSGLHSDTTLNVRDASNPIPLQLFYPENRHTAGGVAWAAAWTGKQEERGRTAPPPSGTCLLAGDPTAGGRRLNFRRGGSPACVWWPVSWRPGRAPPVSAAAAAGSEGRAGLVTSRITSRPSNRYRHSFLPHLPCFILIEKQPMLVHAGIKFKLLSFSFFFFSVISQLKRSSFWVKKWSFFLFFWLLSINGMLVDIYSSIYSSKYWIWLIGVWISFDCLWWRLSNWMVK